MAAKTGETRQYDSLNGQTCTRLPASCGRPLSRGSGLSYPDFINVGAVFPNISRMMREGFPKLADAGRLRNFDIFDFVCYDVP